MARYPASQSLLLLPSDQGELNSTMEAAWTNHLAAKRLIERFRALRPRETCRECGGCGERVSIQLATPTPCPLCRPGPFAEFFANLGPVYHARGLSITGCDDCDYKRCVDRDPTPCELHDEDRAPDTQRSRELDPWDMDPSELNETAALPREAPAYWGRERGDWDEHDNGSDISPKTRTEKA